MILEKIKGGRSHFYLNESYSKFIGLEWCFRPFDILNFNFTADGSEGKYTFSFWFFWVFYISTNVFKKYPKEWNSYTNNKKGDYLNTATRKIGLSQYNGHIDFYLWHSGDSLWDKKDKQYFHFSINLGDIFIGDHKYKVTKKIYFSAYENFTEGLQNIYGEYYTQTKTYDRFYMKPFQTKTYYMYIDSEIKLPHTRLTTSHKDTSKEEYLENEYELPEKRHKIEKDENTDDIIKDYIKNINDLRNKYYENWVPYEYLKSYRRKQKLNKLFKSK